MQFTEWKDQNVECIPLNSAHSLALTTPIKLAEIKFTADKNITGLSITLVIIPKIVHSYSDSLHPYTICVDEWDVKLRLYSLSRPYSHYKVRKSSLKSSSSRHRV